MSTYICRVYVGKFVKFLTEGIEWREVWPGKTLPISCVGQKFPSQPVPADRCAKGIRFFSRGIDVQTTNL